MAKAIIAHGVGKSYLLRHAQAERHTSLRDALTEGAKQIGKRVLSPRSSRPAKRSEETFWALRNVGLDIEEGERIGIIGRNGAGKSTLLKLLSRVTEPSEGRIELRGRVASLLEVGTGFHPELTGRENIFLNGTILGMSAREIRSRFDEIVAFAEVDRFLDTPVKRYSSGMYVRLAFSIAAHLVSEILILDEVLAVGDAGFQQKCMGRIEGTAREGRTVLFVSHSMASVRKLCNRAMYLDQGRIVAQGDTEAVIASYLHDTLPQIEAFAERQFDDQPEKVAVIRRIASRQESGSLSHQFGSNETIWIDLDYELKSAVRDCMIIVAVRTNGTYLFQTHDTDKDQPLLLHRDAGWYRARLPLPARLLLPGAYDVHAKITIGNYSEHGADDRPDALRFNVHDLDEHEPTHNKGYSRDRGMLVRVEPAWETVPLR